MMIAIMRRGGRARLKASDSKSDRGVSPSGVQILSPPPIVLASERLRRAPALDGRADNPRGCAGLRGSTVGQQPPWPGSAARRSGGEPRGWLRRSTVGRRPPWLALAPDGRRIDALDQF